MMSSLDNLWPWLVAVAHVATAVAVTIDAVLRKRHVQSIFGWVGLAWLAPLVGPLMYLCFGINRIRRAAAALHFGAEWQQQFSCATSREGAATAERAAAGSPALSGLARLGRHVTGQYLLPGNLVTPLINGDAAFPRMLAEIDSARHSISLQSYIFDSDEVGSAFCDALIRAARRGVSVRVLIDDVGARYSRPSILQRLHRSGVNAASFLPTLLPRLFRYANLRNHRKILVVDGRIGFTGGMNLRVDHWLNRHPKCPARCLHFAIEGPMVADLQRTFAVDWLFTTAEALQGEVWFPDLVHRGSAIARGISDGPDEDLGNMPSMLLGALAAAERSVDIVTPYFLPDTVLLRTLQITAMRGVEVNLVLPLKSNIAVMDWAMRPQLCDLFDAGCNIYLSPPPFDHTKLFVVDDCWSLIGSSNWDARSLRLNFEYNVECYDRELATLLRAMVQTRIGSACKIDAALLRENVFVRLRNGLARLLSPYL